MTWIEYALRKPEPEPKRQVLAKMRSGYYETFWAHSKLDEWLVTDWAEIEGPIPASFHEGMADIHSGRVTDMETAMNKPPPPDPFEEWWAGIRNRYIIDICGNAMIKEGAARHIWDAAVKHMEGK